MLEKIKHFIKLMIRYANYRDYKRLKSECDYPEIQLIRNKYTSL